MPAAPIALLTDFGHEDAYVGIMKAVILSRCPGASLIDLTHGIPPQEVVAGALQLAAAVPFCPRETIFVAVVDPGVGSARRPICLRSGFHSFVGPDNGLLWPAACAAGTPEAFHLDQPHHWLPQPGSTFHGRDIFAPIAALLAQGYDPADLGTPIPDPERLEFPRSAATPDGILGEVIYIDHFGNAVTNLRPADLGEPEAGSMSFTFESQSLPGPATHYGAVPSSEPVVLLSSFGSYEIAVRDGSAAAVLGLKRGTPVFVSPRSAD